MATSSGSWNGGEQIDEEMPEFLRIPPSDIKIGEQIGRGGFSTVHRASWRGKQCAAKIVQTADVLAIQKEVAILSKLSHPHIVGCIGFSVDSTGDPSRCMILMELMESDLRHLMNERLKKKKNTWPFRETEAVDILCQISSGMQYLHGQGVFHGDLKASNVLVSHDCGGRIHVKITDFGVSQMVKLNPAETSEEFVKKKHFRGAVGTRAYQAPEVSSSEFIRNKHFRFVQGTIGYQAPEVSSLDDSMFQSTSDYQGLWDYEDKKKYRAYNTKSEEFYTAKADTYCFAMTCYEILTGRIPFDSVSKPDIPALVLQGARPELPHGLDLRLVSLIEVCWDKKPSKRPRFSDITHSLDRLSREWSMHNQNKEAPNCWGRVLRMSRRGKWK